MVRLGYVLHVYWDVRIIGQGSLRFLSSSRQECSASRAQVSQNQLELLKGRAKVFDDLSGDHVGVFRFGRVFQAGILEPKEVEAELVSLSWS
jgi:hypothetical protein